MGGIPWRCAGPQRMQGYGTSGSGSVKKSFVHVTIAPYKDLRVGGGSRVLFIFRSREWRAKKIIVRRGSVRNRNVWSRIKFYPRHASDVITYRGQCRKNFGIVRIHIGFCLPDPSVPTFGAISRFVSFFFSFSTL